MKKVIANAMVRGERVLIRRLNVSDVTQRYVDWLNDPEVNQFLSIRGIKQTMDTVKDYVLSFENANNRLLMGIFDSKLNTHIGNITFSSIEWKNDVGIIGIAIGDKNYWGKGCATEALRLVIEYAFTHLGLHRLEVGISINNIPSQKLFEKVGFIKEGLLKGREKFGDEYVDGIIYRLLNKSHGRK